MRRVERDVHEEWLVRFSGVFEKADRFVTDDFAPVLSAFPVTAFGFVVRTPFVLLAFDGSFVTFGSLFWHSCPNRSDMVEDFWRFEFYMPFTREIGFVASVMHLQRPNPIGGLLFLQIKLVGMPDKSAGIEHRSAGHANRAAPRSHIVSVPKLGALASKLVQVGSFDFLVPGLANRVVAVIVGEDHNDVGLTA